MHETPEGYLLCIGVSIARTGEMIYAEGETPLEAHEGKVVVDRDAKEVFRPETIASFEGKAVTISHPADFVSPENWAQLTKGILQNVRQGKEGDANDLVADLLITDSVAINLVKNGLREVSCGYEAEYTQTGIGRGTQSNIIGNHLALVQEGRAGSSYSINDHKGKGLKMSIKEKIKAIFAKAQDEAMKVSDEFPPVEEKKEEKSKDAGSYDELVKICKDLGEKVSALAGKKDEPKDAVASTQPTMNQPAEIKAKDSEEEMEKKKASRDAWIDAQMEKEMKDTEVDPDEEEEESEDGDFEESPMTGDTASRVEILAPGMDSKAKDVKAKALIAAYATKDGKEVINRFTGGKLPDVKDAAQIEAVFVGASEVLKATRTASLAKTKTNDFNPSEGSVTSGDITAEKLNEMNEKHYGKKA